MVKMEVDQLAVEEQHSLIQALFTSIRSSIVSMEVEKIKAMVAREEEINGSQATVAVLTYSSGDIRRIEKIARYLETVFRRGGCIL